MDDNLFNDVLRALEPFSKGADKADERDDEHKRLFGNVYGENASPGLGITFKHLRDARILYRRLLSLDKKNR